MKETTSKIITYCGLAVAILCMVLAILFAMKNPGDEVKLLEDVRQGGLFDATYWILVGLIAISIGAIIVFLVVKLAKRFANEKGYLTKFLIILGVCAAVVVVSLLLSTGNDVNEANLSLINDDLEAAKGISKLIGAACYMVYILVFGAAICIIYSEIVKSLKKKAK